MLQKKHPADYTAVGCFLLVRPFPLFVAHDALDGGERVVRQLHAGSLHVLLDLLRTARADERAGRIGPDDDTPRELLLLPAAVVRQPCSPSL